jgi:hypothetical protein
MNLVMAFDYDCAAPRRAVVVPLQDCADMQVACFWLWRRGCCAGRLEAVWWRGHTCGAPQAAVRISKAPASRHSSLEKRNCFPLDKQGWGSVALRGDAEATVLLHCQTIV